MRRRIVLVSGATTVLVLVAYLAPLLLLVQQLARTRAMAEARAGTQTVATVLLTVDDVQEARIGVDMVNAKGPLRTTVFYPDGTRLGAPVRITADELHLATSQRAAFDAPAPGGRAIYLPVDVGSDPCCVVVRTFVPTASLRAGVLPASVVLTGLAAVLLATTLGLAGWLARSLARPLTDVADVARALHDGDLTRRAAPDGPPEIAAIGTALNRLADRIDRLVQAERETVADLSHRVRTPLTALRLDLESLHDPEEAERLSAGVDEVERSVNQVIAQARTPRRPAAPPSASLTAVVRGRLEFWSVLAHEQRRPITTDLPPGDVVVPVAADELEAAIDALVGNVLVHTPAGTKLTVSVQTGPPARLVVEDAGPGIREGSLVERGRSGAGSTGLGLDIARRTAAAAGGGLELGVGRSGRGLRAVVTLGP